MIALLVNPAAGNGKAKKSGEKIQAILIAKKIAHTLFIDTWPTVLENFTEVWIIGGDGTLNYYLNNFHINSLPISIFPGGTGNDFAWKLYAGMQIDVQVDYVLQAVVRSVDIGNCNGMLYANSSGIGFDGEVLKSIKSIRSIGGHIGYLWVVIKKIFSFKEVSFHINVEGKIYNEKFLLVVVNNSSRTGGGFFVTPHASLTDGKLDVLLCSPLSLFKRLKYLPIIEKGRHLHLPFIKHSLAQEITVECTEKVFAQLDGELIDGEKFHFKILPGWLKIKY